jgi:RNA polymerase-binding protein DksA
VIMARVRNIGRKARRTKPTRMRPRGVSRDRKRGIERPDGKGKSSQKAESSLTQREKLIRERAQVVEELTRLRAELQEAPEPTGDEVDLNVYEREKTLGLVAAYELRLEKIDNALRAAEKGEYGTCQRCGRPIDPARLKIFPETRYCVSCQGELERLAKRRGA